MYQPKSHCSSKTRTTRCEFCGHPQSVGPFELKDKNGVILESFEAICKGCQKEMEDDL